MGAQWQWERSSRADRKTLRTPWSVPPAGLLRPFAIALIAVLSAFPLAAADSQAVLNRARNLLDRGQTPAAEKLLRTEHQAALAAKDEVHQAWMAFGLGWGMAKLSRNREAISWLEEAAGTAGRLNQSDIEGMARFSLGRCLRRMGRKAEARRQFERAIETLREARHFDVAALAVLDLAHLETNLRAREAILREAVAQAQASGPRLEGQLLLVWARSQFFEGNSSGAMATFRRCIELLEKRKLWRLLAAAYTGLGRVYRMHNDFDSAIHAYRKALQLHEQIDAPLGKSEALELLGLAYAAQGNRQQAVESLEAALAIARQKAAPRALGKRVIAVAVAYLLLHEYEKTVAVIGDFLSTRQRPHCQIYWTMSAALWNLKRYGEAARYAGQGVDACRATGRAEALARSLLWRARSLEALGHRESAIEAAKESLLTVERMREHAAPEDQLKRGFDEAYQALVQDAVRWLHDSNRFAESLEVAEQGRARAFVDLLVTNRSAEFTDDEDAIRLPAAASEPELASNASTKAATLPRFQELARQLNSSILSYWAAPGEVFVWVADARGLRSSVRRPLSQQKLETLTRQAAAKQGPVCRAALRELYRLLIEPVEAALPAAGTRLTIIPHGPLFRLPFAALVDAKGKYLIERWEPHYAPSIATLEATSAGSDSQGGYLLVGNPVHPAAPVGAAPLAPLPGSRRELFRIRSLLPPTAAPVLLSGKQSRLDPVLDAMSSASVLHFATHAVVDQDRPFESYLALSEGDRLTAREIYEQDLPARLVMLSACRSATGDISPDGVLGLTRAFFSAGVARVVASIWDAADQTSSLLAEAFHREYLHSQDAAAALRKAQLGMLARLRAGKVEVDTPAGPAVVSEHPALWAPFVLEGRP